MSKDVAGSPRSSTTNAEISFWKSIQKGVLENKGTVVAVLLSMGCLCFLFMQCIFWKSHQARYSLLERQIIEQLRMGQKEAVSRLGNRYKKRPMLYKAADPYLLECHFQQNNVAEARSVAHRMFAKSPESISAYIQFSEASLAIQAQDYALALEQTLQLQKVLQESEQTDSQLFQFCSLRISWLHKKLGDMALAKESLGTFPGKESKTSLFLEFEETISHLGISLVDYIANN